MPNTSIHGVNICLSFLQAHAIHLLRKFLWYWTDLNRWWLLINTGVKLGANHTYVFLLAIQKGLRVENLLICFRQLFTVIMHNMSSLGQNLIIWYVECSCVMTVMHAQVNWSVIAVHVRYELLIVFIMPCCSHDEATPMNNSAGRLMWTSDHSWKKLYSCCEQI